MSRLAALVRHVLDVPSRTEVHTLRRGLADQGMLWSLTALERRPPAAYLPGEAGADLDRALDDFGGLVPLVPAQPAPPSGPPPWFIALAVLAWLVAMLLALSALPSCTIRGAESCSDVGGCVDMRRPDAAVPSPGGPL